VNNAPSERKATHLGTYELVRELGHGGMAEVFLARASGPHGFEKLVVLKKILPQFAAMPKYVRLFLDEAKLAACLDHPNIAQVHHFGMVDGNYCFVMEYVHGRDLRTVLHSTKQAFPIEHAVRIARDIAAALHYAHERRGPDGAPMHIVHRDVSPSNIQISYDGTVKLLDFGIAKARTSTIQTRTGILKGKSGYLAPEQARRKPVDRRADVFALGIVLWEMVTGQHLFDVHDDLHATEQMLTEDPRPPSSLRRGCPRELDAIILRALSREPEGRQQTARELQIELEELAREHRLNQSSVALSELMHGLFGAEIRAAEPVDVSTPTVTDLIAASAEGTPPDEAGDERAIDEESTRSLSDAELGKLLAQVRRPAGSRRFEDSMETTIAGPPRPVAEPAVEGPTSSLDEARTRPVIERTALRPPAPATSDLSHVATNVMRLSLQRRARRRRWLVLVVLGALALSFVTAIVVRRLLAHEPPAAAQKSPVGP